MPIVVKSFDDLVGEAVNRLVNLGYTDAQYAGTGVRNILEAVLSPIADAYIDQQTNIQDAFLTQAQGPALDALGLLVGKVRYQGETEQNFRLRISTALTTIVGANLTSLVEALLGLAAVRDVIVRPFTQGLGSVTFYLIGTQGIVDPTTLATAQATIGSLESGGVFSTVTTPTPVQVNLQGIVSLSGSVPVAQGQAVKDAAANAVNKYISDLSMGAPFVKAKADQIVLDSSNGQIIDFVLTGLATVNTAGVITDQLVRNYQPQFDEQLFPGTILFS